MKTAIRKKVFYFASTDLDGGNKFGKKTSSGRNLKIEEVQFSVCFLTNHYFPT